MTLSKEMVIIIINIIQEYGKPIRVMDKVQDFGVEVTPVALLHWHSE